MKFLGYNDIIREASATPNGRFIRVGYCKELKLLKGWPEKGIRAYKLTETTVRLGVAYANIAAVKARKEAEEDKPKVQRANNWEWIIPNKVKANSNTGKTYLQVATVEGGHNTHSQFLVYDPHIGWTLFEKPEWELSEYYLMTDKKSRESSSHPDIYTITFDNIYKLGSSRA